MSVSLCPPPVPLHAHTLSSASYRKRTTSFSTPCPSSSSLAENAFGENRGNGAGANPRPRKRLHRTESVVDLSFTPNADATTSTTVTTPQGVPYTRTLRFYKEQKERRRALVRAALSSSSPISTPEWTSPTPRAAAWQGATTQSLPPPPRRPTATATLHLPPARSPLARSCPLATAPRCAYVHIPRAERRTTAGTGVPPGSGTARPASPSTAAKSPPKSPASLPRTPSSRALSSLASTPPAPSKKKTPRQPTTLHRRALLAAFRATPSGAKILHMGARLAVGVLGATAELERICAYTCSEGDASCSEEVDGDGEEYLPALEMDCMDADIADVLLDEGEGELDAMGPLFAHPDADGWGAPDQDQDEDADAEDEDVPMPDAPPSLSASWIVVGEGEASQGWEMVG
ncbi:hypothetical protein DFH07DRAFT_429110 [Mycena maculata]|uniref:Uncharacterized protein n=1 Tax=Mycena maculata TaxID=230809 RepID=A0AAD7JAY9_9AGAR|nr:hypothetical protein DFH07DRAFT_429110 [Mycena maculata]